MQAYKIMAKDQNSPTRIQKQFTSGHVITELAEANLLALEFAREQSARTRGSWVAVVETYTVGAKPGSL